MVKNIFFETKGLIYRGRAEEGWSSICFGDEHNAVRDGESRAGPRRLAAVNQLDHSLKFRRKNAKRQTQRSWAFALFISSD